MSHKISLDDLHKLESSSVSPLAQPEKGMVQAIIKVNSPDYIPQFVQVRATISPVLFTGEFGINVLESLEKDPNVESVSISRKLRSAEQVE